jgi:hypothetical protein
MSRTAVVRTEKESPGKPLQASTPFLGPGTVDMWTGIAVSVAGGPILAASLWG